MESGKEVTEGAGETKKSTRAGKPGIYLLPQRGKNRMAPHHEGVQKDEEEVVDGVTNETSTGGDALPNKNTEKSAAATKGDKKA